MSILRNRAEHGAVGTFGELENSEIERVLPAHFYSVMSMMRATLRTMREQGSGRVKNMTSLAGLVGLQHCSALSAAELAIEGLSQAVALGFFSAGLRDFHFTYDARVAPECPAAIGGETLHSSGVKIAHSEITSRTSPISCSRAPDEQSAKTFRRGQ